MGSDHADRKDGTQNHEASNVERRGRQNIKDLGTAPRQSPRSVQATNLKDGVADDEREDEDSKIDNARPHREELSQRYLMLGINDQKASED